MGLDRRNFLKTMGVAGAALAVGKPSQAAGNKGKYTEFYGILYDSVKCIGCQNCEVACTETYGFPEITDTPLVGTERHTSETRRTILNVQETSRGEVYTREQCMHCNEPACAAACLTQAMYKTEEGPVIWRGDKCMGCRYCMVSCPFDVPKFEYHSSNPKIEKCTMCYERIMEGGIPACVESCGFDALLFGTRRELLTEARKRICAEPTKYSDHIFGEKEAGGTGLLMLTPLRPQELGYRTNIGNESYPALTKGFLFAVPSVFVLIPPLLLGIHEATKNKGSKQEEEEV
ncbi:MAG TPA: 4Fe-4S dicluster domain-containing protein [Bacteroidales bacterium]|nr:4Fe-4S dicluster domain-containing protein [Bacteroidales bacterium]HSA42304.1 4Fe-4S dicluster domain-containing protein [Bacteroidales bacterium]